MNPLGYVYQILDDLQLILSRKGLFGKTEIRCEYSLDDCYDMRFIYIPTGKPYGICLHKTLLRQQANELNVAVFREKTLNEFESFLDKAYAEGKL